MKHFPRRVKRNFSGKVSIRNLSRGEELSQSRDFAFLRNDDSAEWEKKKEIGHEEEEEEEELKNALK